MPLPKTFLAVLVTELGQRFQIIPAEVVGIDLHPLLAFRFLEFYQSRERERYFGFIQDVEHDHVVPPMSQSAQGVQHGQRVGQQIGKQHDQTAMPQHGGDLRQALGNVGRPLRVQPREV